MVVRYTISEITDEIKSILEKGFNGSKYIILTGEISNFRISGKHTYFDLKDDNSMIGIAFWGNHLNNANGDDVEVTGRIDYYSKSNKINFVGSSIKNIGKGAAHTEYEKRYKKFNDLGYFNNRKNLPESITNVGIVTSKEGAALHDFIYVLKNNGFIGTVYVYNCLVQGDKCHQSIASGIKFFNNSFDVNVDDMNDIDVNDLDTDSSNSSDSSDDPLSLPTIKSIKSIRSASSAKNKIKAEVDIIVVTRGGGSFEDLMGFSHETVVEAIYHSKKYIISAVGHEIDNMLSDFVANYRAPTPSIAGGVISNISCNRRVKLNDLEKKSQYIKQEIHYKLKKFKDDVNNLKLQIVDPNQMIKERQDKITEIIKNLSHIKRDIYFKLNAYRENVIVLQTKIIDPYEVLRLKIDSLIKEKDRIKYLIHNDLDKFKNQMNDLQSKLEMTAGTEKAKALLEQGFILFIDNKGYIVQDSESLFDTNLKMIHSTGTYDVTIKKIDKIDKKINKSTSKDLLNK